MDELSDEFAVKLGRAFGSCFDPDIAVGRDTRKSGPRLESAFNAGLLSTGTDVTELGVVPTPTVGVATAEIGLGAVVTASHNPPEYNGFKFFDEQGAFRPDEEDRVQEKMESGSFRDGAGSLTDADYVSRHIQLIVDAIGEAEGVKVFLDCAGGAGSVVTPLLLRELGCEVDVVNDNLDGVFPHPLEPTAENLSDTLKQAAKSGCDVAFAHDGDADRTCAIDDKGGMIEWDTFLTALASQSKKVVTTVDASMRVEEYCRKVYRVPVGDVAVAEGIRRHNAGFGGEPSGTYIFPDVHMYPDGVATVAKTVKMVADGLFYDLVKEIPSYPMERVKMPCKAHEKGKIMDNLIKNLKGLDFTDVDGVRLEEDYGWVLIRPSGTEDYIRVTAEAKTREKLDELVKKGKHWVNGAC